MNKVMVIDDEPFILMMIEDKLKSAGISVIVRRESGGALPIIKRERPDLLILDWMMPEVSGIELCRMVKGDPETTHIPVFLLTAKGQESDRETGLNCGATMYITKPFSPRALLDSVKKTLAHE